MMRHNRLTLAMIFAAAIAGSPAHADEGHSHGAPIGKPGKPTAATRTVSIELRDISYEPATVQVKAGETVRFVVKNTGELLHEFNIGTPTMHTAHQKEMQAMMDHGMLTPTGIDQGKMKMDHSKMGMAPMKHDDPNTVLVEPGKTAELTWTFAKPMKLEFACNIPGHYEAGMVGAIEFGR